MEDVANVLEVLQGVQNSLGYRNMGSVLDLARIIHGFDDEDDEEREDEDIDDRFDSNAPLPSMNVNKAMLRISKSVPAGFGIDEEDEPEADDDGEGRFSLGGRFPVTRDERPPSF